MCKDTEYPYLCGCLHISILFLMKKRITITAFLCFMLSVAVAQFKYYGSDNQPEGHSAAITGGTGAILGDLPINLGYQGGAYYQYRFARWLGVRIGVNYGKYSGLGTTPTPILPNNALNGVRDSTLNYIDSTNYIGVFYPNYRMTALDISVTGKLHLIELFSKTYNKPFTVYLMGGVGAFSYLTKMNARNANNSLYPFQQIDASGEVKTQLTAMLDNTYETDAEYKAVSTISPFVSFGGGLRYRIGQHLGISLEAMGKYNSDDLLDGFQWKTATELSSSRDILGTGNLGVEWLF